MIARYTLLLAGLALFATTALGYVPKCPMINTKYGTVVGSSQVSREMRSYMSFKGIPYAKPPINDLRFKAPEPPEPWKFAFNATDDGSFCIQKNYFFAKPIVEGKEDCLYMNIYVPDTETPDLLPVMVFIHWGGFFAGRGTSDYLGPEYFMDRDVILVTFNYRLGVFGFFSTLDDTAPGNFGLKDQVLALRFVQENIEAFGGNKSRVTLFGQSAGGGSTSLHLISPSSLGLFQQAISQSGTGLNLWAKPFNPAVPIVNKVLAGAVDCHEQIENSTNFVECLRKVDSHVLTAAGDIFKTFSVEPLTPFPLVIETKTSANPEPFITKDPGNYFLSGEFQKVPYMIGVVQDEGILRASAFIRQPDTLHKLNEKFTELLPNLLVLQLSVTRGLKEFTDSLIDFYLGGNPYINISDANSVQGFINLYSDRAFVYGTFQAIILQSMKKHKPIWVYNFDYKGRQTYGDLFAATNQNIDFKWGVSHCDDLLYLFKSPALFKDLKDADLRMSRTMVKLWTDFAITGTPDPDRRYFWESLNFSVEDGNIENANLNFLNISGSIKTNNIEFKHQTGFYEKRVDFWLNSDLAENALIPRLRTTTSSNSVSTTSCRSPKKDPLF